MLSKCSYQVDVADTCGSTPLMDSLRAGFLDVAEILIQKHKVGVKISYTLTQVKCK